jgi:hypothetical protein
MDFTKTMAALGSAFGARDLLKAVEDLSLGEAWDAVGLARKRTSVFSVPALGRLTLSGAFGAGIALFLPARSGRRFRARLTDRVEATKRRVNDRISELESARRQRHAIS